MRDIVLTFGLLVEGAVNEKVVAADRLHSQPGSGKPEVVFGDDGERYRFEEQNGGFRSQIPEVNQGRGIIQCNEADTARKVYSESRLQGCGVNTKLPIPASPDCKFR